MSIFMETTDPLKRDYIYEYTMLMLEQQLNDRIMFLEFVDENCEGIIDEAGQLISINEGMVAGVVDFSKKIVNTIMNVVQKCIDDIAAFIENDKKFLSDNEKLIKTGENINKGDTIENCYHYEKAITDITNDKLRFDPPKIDDLRTKAGVYETPAKYAKATFGELAAAIDENSKEPIKAQLMNWYRKDLVNLRDTEIDQTLRQNMWEYCAHGMDRAMESLKKDKDRLVQSEKMLNSALKELVNTATKENPGEATETTTGETKTTTTTTTTAQEKPNEAVTLKSTMDTYFNEADRGPTGGPDDKKPGGVTVVKADDKNNGGDDDKEEKKPNEIAQIATAIKSYYKAESQLISAKMALAIKGYGQYMKIMRWFVNRSKEDKPTAKIDDEDRKAVGI